MGQLRLPSSLVPAQTLSTQVSSGLREVASTRRPTLLTATLACSKVSLAQYARCRALRNSRRSRRALGRRSATAWASTSNCLDTLSPLQNCATGRRTVGPISPENCSARRYPSSPISSELCPEQRRCPAQVRELDPLDAISPSKRLPLTTSSQSTRYLPRLTRCRSSIGCHRLRNRSSRHDHAAYDGGAISRRPRSRQPCHHSCSAQSAHSRHIGHLTEDPCRHSGALSPNCGPPLLKPTPLLLSFVTWRRPLSASCHSLLSCDRRTHNPVVSSPPMRPRRSSSRNLFVSPGHPGTNRSRSP